MNEISGDGWCGVVWWARCPFTRTLAHLQTHTHTQSQASQIITCESARDPTHAHTDTNARSATPTKMYTLWFFSSVLHCSKHRKHQSESTWSLLFDARTVISFCSAVLKKLECVAWKLCHKLILLLVQQLKWLHHHFSSCSRRHKHDSDVSMWIENLCAVLFFIFFFWIIWNSK